MGPNERDELDKMLEVIKSMKDLGEMVERLEQGKRINGYDPNVDPQFDGLMPGHAGPDAKGKTPPGSFASHSAGLNIDPVRELHLSELFNGDLPKARGFIVAAVTDKGIATQFEAVGLDAGEGFAVLGADLAGYLADGTDMDIDQAADMLKNAIDSAVMNRKNKGEG